MRRFKNNVLYSMFCAYVGGRECAQDCGLPQRSEEDVAYPGAGVKAAVNCSKFQRNLSPLEDH